MDESILKETQALREKALHALQAVPEFATFKALDDAVFAMGGARRALGFAPQRLVSEPGATAVDVASRAAALAALDVSHITPIYRPASPPKRLTQPDAAEECLAEAGKPMTVTDLLKQVEAKGISFSGTDPAASFGSQLSRNPTRFENRRIDGQSYWWLRGRPWPSSENEAPDLPLGQLSGASSSDSSQEGGDAHAATTAN